MISDVFSTSELRYRRLFEAAHDGILIVDPETRRIIDVNPFLANFLGYEYDEIIGKELFEIGLLKDEAASQAAFRELQSAGFIRYDDLPLETRDGRRVEVEFVSNIYREGDLQVIQYYIRDISARKRADAALRESEERFKLVARAVSDVIWDWNLATDKLWRSDSFMSTFGYTAAEIEPGIESLSSRIHPEDRSRVVESIHEAIDTGAESWAADYRFRCKNGSYAFVQDSGCILRSATGKGIRMVGGMRDVTQQKKMEAQYMRAQRLDSIGTLAGGIAHDLNNVLTPIMLSIELLQRSPDNDPTCSSILETIQLSCRRGADLVRQVLAFARGLDGQRITIQLRHVVDDLKRMISETFPRNIRIVTHIPPDLWSIKGDSTQLHQVLLNLAVNARDAMPGGGTLTLSAANTTLDAQYAGTSREGIVGRFVLLEERDTGMGIPLEIRERVAATSLQNGSAGSSSPRNAKTGPHGPNGCGDGRSKFPATSLSACGFRFRDRARRSRRAAREPRRRRRRC